MCVQHLQEKQDGGFAPMPHGISHNKKYNLTRFRSQRQRYTTLVALEETSRNHYRVKFELYIIQIKRSLLCQIWYFCAFSEPIYTHLYHIFLYKINMWNTQICIDRDSNIYIGPYELSSLVLPSPHFAIGSFNYFPQQIFNSKLNGWFKVI